MFVANQHKIEGSPDSVPEIKLVSYDLCYLKITLNFKTHSNPIHIQFSTVGFRVLDEGQLLEYWSEESRAPGWLWRIESGGWFEQESERDGFLMGHFAKNGNRQPHEYLLLGENDCINVFSWDEPKILMHEP